MHSIDRIMKTCEWTPKHRSRALALIEDCWHKLREVSQMTNISIDTLGDLRKCDISLTKTRSGRYHRLFEWTKRQVECHIRRNHASRRLSTETIIKDLQFQVCSRKPGERSMGVSISSWRGAGRESCWWLQWHGCNDQYYRVPISWWGGICWETWEMRDFRSMDRRVV